VRCTCTSTSTVADRLLYMSAAGRSKPQLQYGQWYLGGLIVCLLMALVLGMLDLL
jgi:hypothetical protein